MSKNAIQAWNGFVNLYKPPGLSSFMAVRKIKRLRKGMKIGHLGTLDPMAEGILPLALGNATRLIPYIQDRSKRYTATAVLGASSDTQDIWGQVEYGDLPKITAGEIESIINGFRGSIKQVPPMYSAVHHQGKRLYELARQGLEVERQPRDAYIYNLSLVKFEKPADGTYPVMHLEVHCSEGTYIRTLCHDIGGLLGCGAVMSGLARNSWGIFDEHSSIGLEQFENGESVLDRSLMPLDYPLQELSIACVDDSESLYRLNNGRCIEYNGPAGDGLFRIKHRSDGRLLGLARYETSEAGQFLQPVLVIKQQQN